MSTSPSPVNLKIFTALAILGIIFLAVGAVSSLLANKKLEAIEKQAKYFNHCVEIHIEENPKYLLDEIVVHCNGSYREPKISVLE